MHDLRCPNCRFRLWLYQGVGRAVPRECPGCHVSRPIDSSDAAAARLAARIASEHRAGIMARECADIRRQPPFGPGASR
jgi:hypothetical protein